MSTAAATMTVQDAVMVALATVMDPELDEPITDLGFVTSVAIDDAGVAVRLRLPTSFCAPNFAYLMTADAQDALRTIPHIGAVVVALDDHHDSDKINQGLAANAGYLGTFPGEADDSLDELRLTFQRKAHTAAVERCCAYVMKSGPWTLENLADLTLGDLPAVPITAALLKRRHALGLSVGASARVFVDDQGTPIAPDDIPLRLRFATSVRISIEGNAHFCRGLLATRYGDGEEGVSPTRITNTRRTT